MTLHSDKAYLEHMLAHAREALHHAKGCTRDDVQRERLLQLALLHLIEIVGEAASKVSAATRDQLSHFPWKGMIGMRNRIIHGYDTANIDVLWDTLQEDLPDLVQKIQDALKDFADPDTEE